MGVNFSGSYTKIFQYRAVIAAIVLAVLLLVTIVVTVGLIIAFIRRGFYTGGSRITESVKFVTNQIRVW